MKLFILLCISTPALASFQCGLHLPKLDNNDTQTRHARSIIGGKVVTTPGKWPWHLILDNDYGVCGGTLISPQWVLTAAHCVHSLEDVILYKGAIMQPRMQVLRETNGTGPLRFIAGAKNYSDFKDILLTVAEIRIHAGWNYSSILETPQTYTREVSPICLPSPSQFIPVDGQAVATGIGKINIPGTNNITDMDGKLREVIVPIKSKEDCEKSFSDDQKQLRKVICANSLNHGLHSGDSGGPLMMKASDGRWFQLGVFSFQSMVEIGVEDKINAFTDIRPYCDWIREQTDGEVKCQEEEVNLEDVEIKT